MLIFTTGKIILSFFSIWLILYGETNPAPPLSLAGAGGAGMRAVSLPRRSTDRAVARRPGLSVAEGRLKGNFGPRGSTSCWLLCRVDEAVSVTSPCEYHSLLPLHRHAGEIPIDGGEVGSCCVARDGLLVLC
jgi:hypothetical protein